MKLRTKLIGISAAAFAVAVGTYAFTASSQESRHGFGPHAMGHGMARMMGRGMMGHGGNAATANQVRDIHALLADHTRIKRTVTNLPDGIRTVTESDDPTVAQTIKTHVADMMRRVEAGDNADLPMQTSRLHAIFRNKDKIATKWETTEKGIVVVQTSSDPETIAALQAHAADVTGLVQGGMPALHAAMMREGGSMHGAMGGHMGGHMMGHGMMHGGSGHDHR